MLESAKQPLSAADSKLKASVVSSLDDLRREKRIFKAKAMDPNIMPWVLASRVIGGPMDFEPSDISTWYSSGWIILPAYQVRATIQWIGAGVWRLLALQEFVEGLKQVYALQIRGGRTFGSTGVRSQPRDQRTYIRGIYFLGCPKSEQRVTHGQSGILH